MRPRSNRIGRNSPCHCGSGKKYKHCHWQTEQAAVGSAPKLERVPIPPHVLQMFERHKASEARRESAQGKGRPIISAEANGNRFVAIGNTLATGRWRTFPEFLIHYLRHSFGAEWVKQQQGKAQEDQHPVLNWWAAHVVQVKEATAALKGADDVRTLPANTATWALLMLAYNLYLLQHNAELQARLLERLRRADQFRGAYYETMVAACFILAGFKLTLLDETTGLTRSCEFNAQGPSGRIFAVEAKSRLPGKANVDVGNQLVDALRKDTPHERVVFIDLNTDAAPTEALAITIGKSIRGREAGLTIKGLPAPAAYVIVTNLPNMRDVTGYSQGRFAVAEGFKIPDFGSSTFTSLIDQFKAEQRHGDVLAVFQAFGEYQIPSTFDGELPEVAFGGVKRRWLHGESYDLNSLGLDAKGQLISAAVDESSHRVALAFSLPGGKSCVLHDILSEDELAAYRRHPESFFGTLTRPVVKVDTPIALFKVFHESYRSTPRQTLLEFLASATDIERLSTLPTEELLLEYCNRHVLAAISSGVFGPWPGTRPPDSAEAEQGG